MSFKLPKFFHRNRHRELEGGAAEDHLAEIHDLTIAQAIAYTRSRPEGLTAPEAAERLLVHGGKDRGGNGRETGALSLFVNQFRSPLILLLLAAMLLSMILGDHTDALIVTAVVLMSTLLGFWQEYRASNALAALLAVVQAKSTVVRDGVEVQLTCEQIVPGDVVILNAGDTIPGDALILESKDLFVDESALTGESFPSEKGAGAGGVRHGPRSNAVFKGTHVVSGTARILTVTTGAETEFGKISGQLRLRAPETDFERGLRHFGDLLVRMTMVLVISIIGINLLFQRPALESFMFALALAVGMTPELLPAIVSITLARGARRMARDHVIVRRLHAIENFGTMNVLCSDKTGTLTEGRMRLMGVMDPLGHESAQARLHATLNASFESGFTNPIDEALRAESHLDLSFWDKVDEVPYDFTRKRLSVVVTLPPADGAPQKHLMITKGAFAKVLEVCTHVACDHGPAPMEEWADALQERFQRYSNEGRRVLGLAVRDVTDDPVINKDDECNMTFEGFLLFEDKMKEGAADAVQELKHLGVRLKIITGDSKVAAHRAGLHVGLAAPQVLTGAEIRGMQEMALMHAACKVDIFAETEPSQKERIILALRRSGNVIGYLGDGINDASALHAADVGISVEGAVDVAKEAADIVLLRHDLGVLARGVRNGRVTFANTLKYVFITSSANFGNMFSMAGASFLLPFLPLLPKQILLNNFLSDLPAMAVATDSVDPEQLKKPRRWDNKSIRQFMVIFGLLSSLFDFLTFGVLIAALHASEQQFQTGWFIESLMTELFIVMVIRTRGSCFKSRPSGILFISTLVVAGIAVFLPWTSLGHTFGLVPLPVSFMLALMGITISYLVASEALKRTFFARLDRQQTERV